MLCHRNVVNFFVGMDEPIPHDPPGVWLAVTSLSFDISVLELFWTLARGFKVILYKEGGKEYSIPALIKRHKVTHFQCTPSLASILLVDDNTRAALSAVQTFMAGGEAFPMSGDIINMYGPTETTVWSSTYPVSQEQRTIPIGRPIANTELYIVDRKMQPVPVGVAGELFIGGDGVARGYLNRPELTAERFIDDPFSDEPDARLYRTGDLARYRPNGNIEFLGRIDHQVKIRGHRIELGEIEAVLGQHPAVREAVVIAREDVPGDKRLVAYIILHQKRGVSSSELRDYLKKKLPEFMVPSNFVTLDAFPLTPNGKVNRRALPIPASVRPELENDYVAPRSSTEKVLAKVWSEVLGVEKIGIYDNFFDLGGHSLSAVQIIMRIRQTCNVELPLKTFLHDSTLAGLAEKVEEKLLEQSVLNTHINRKSVV
jgi:acyl-CoA synthetase (AMP-forming)/AMP-acid ligase II/acyl carrier protein